MAHEKARKPRGRWAGREGYDQWHPSMSLSELTRHCCYGRGVRQHNLVHVGVWLARGEDSGDTSREADIAPREQGETAQVASGRTGGSEGAGAGRTGVKQKASRGSNGAPYAGG